MEKMQCSEELNDEDRPSNTLELFVELDEVIEMINNIKECDSPKFEKDLEHFNIILNRYQEQPHLLDSHLETLLTKILEIVRNPNSSMNLIHSCFKYLYVISKVRTYKALVKFLPHELSDLDFALNLLELQDPEDSEHWETRYILLLWLSILVLNPFHMSRLDAYVVNENENIKSEKKKTKMERIYQICKLYTLNNDTCCTVAAFLSAKYFIRADIKDIYLEEYLKWIMQQHDAETNDVKFGQLAAIAAILKHGKREDLLKYADILLKWILSCNYKNNSEFLKQKYYIKIIQRIGLVYLKPRVATWRYKRGSRSLTMNLMQFEENVIEKKIKVEDKEEKEEGDEEITVPDSIEEVIEELLQGLRSPSSDVRWNAAKGLGRVTNRISKVLGDEVIGSVIDILSPLEPHEAWHGACLAIAELAKRGLLLPYRLKDIVPLLQQALFYDEMRAYMSVGQHIRDAACYMCWAFARAYDPKDIQPFINEIASGLLIVAVFDREINCRRAASAAFQESVGRLGNFPHGIDITTTVDFFSVGLRINSYLHLSDYIAQFDEYTKPLIDHLIEKKVGHWDTVIRELSAKALNKLTKRAPTYLANEIIPLLFKKTDSIDINSRHGAVLAIGEIILALRDLELSSNGTVKFITNQIENDLNELILKFFKREQFRGMSGEIMKQCCTNFISDCSKAKIKASFECIESWQEVIDKSLINKSAQIRESATNALKNLCEAYYNEDDRAQLNQMIVDNYLKGSENDLEEHIRMGYLSAIGSLPKFMLKLRLENILNNLIKYSLPPHGALQALISGDKNAQKDNENPITNNWSEARRDSIKALANVVETIGFDKNYDHGSGDDDSVGLISNPKYFEKIFECYIKALGEYTLDNRGDIGAWVREAAMYALYQLLTSCPHELLNPNIVHEVMTRLAQQAVEKIDRTRGIAGKLFCKLIYHKPEIPFIQKHEELREIFPEDSSQVLWLHESHSFPIFCKMLQYEEYSKRILLGLSASIGQLTESLVKHSSVSFFDFLRSYPDHVSRICDEIIIVFEENSLNKRVTHPMLNFLDILLSSGTVDNILSDPNCKFPDEIFRLVNIEVKGHKKLYKLISSINVYCQLIQVPRLATKILSKMAIFLGFQHVHVRKTTATKLYEAIALHSDCTQINEENIDEILSLLSETDWGMPLNEIRQVRNKLCDLMGVKPPVVAVASNISTSINK